MSNWILVLGATSAIARATAAAFAQRGYSVYLAGRDEEELSRSALDFQLRFNVKTAFGLFDAERPETHGEFFSEVQQTTGGIEGVVMAVGYLGDPMATRSFPLLNRVFQANLVGPASILGFCADYFEARKTGFIVGISSVAGDRGRQSNYVYGAAKGGLSRYLQGLRNRLYNAGVTVLDVKPGFVDTAMTFGLPGLFLVASPQYVGECIARAVEKQRDTIYVPWFWGYIMLIIRSIPEFLFKRLKL
jgi:short-subunit dehydrogenase